MEALGIKEFNFIRMYTLINYSPMDDILDYWRQKQVVMIDIRFKQDFK